MGRELLQYVYSPQELPLFTFTETLNDDKAIS